MVTKKTYWKETMDLLQDLFGNADAALRFHNNLPLDYKLDNTTIHKAFLVEQNICRYCWHNIPFTECKHIIKRTVDHCNGAFVELVKSKKQEVRYENRKGASKVFN